MWKEAELIYNRSDMGRRIRKIRQEMNITCEEMAQRLHMDKGEYMRVEQGEGDAPLEIVMQIASFFQVTIDFLIYGMDEPMSVELPEDGEDEEIISLLESSGSAQREMAFKLMQVYLSDENVRG